jgi:CheY-like chemotaxis protein
MSKEQKKVLIIDDSSVNNVLLENVLEDQNYEVLISFRGDEALELINKEHPDIILLDIMMPGMDGYKILEELKSKEPTKDIPVIMVSAKSDSLDIDKAMELGASDYIVKPINIKTIIEKIQAHI